MLVPLIVLGALASAAWAADATALGSAAQGADATGVPRGPVAIVPMSGDAVPGVGSYLIGAVADLGGAPATALRGYMAALAEDPDNMELRERTFELALMAGDVANAVRLARTMPEVEQTTMTRLVQMADLARSGQVGKARAMAREVAKVSPELLQFRLMQVYLDYAQGSRVPELVAWLDTQPMPESMNGRKFYHQARLWLKAGEPDKALAALKKAHAVEPGAVGSTILLGQVLARQGNPDAAAAVYETFRANNPAVALLVPAGRDILNEQPPAFASTVDEDLASTFADFGLLIWAQGALAPARQVLNLSLWLNPDDVFTRYYAGMLLEMGGDLPAAKAHYALLAQGGAQVPVGVRISAQIRLAEVQFRESDEETPWVTLRKLARANPEVASLQRSVAQLAFNRGEYEDAVDGYTELLKRLPDGTPAPARAELLFARGAALERDGEVKKATADMQAALALVPANPQVMNYLGYMWVDNDMNIPEAFELLKKAHLLAPQDGAITDSVGWAYYKQGEFAVARNYLEIATEQDPESPEIFDHLGDAYAKLGRQEEAQRAWQRALDLVEAGKSVPSDTFERTVRRKIR